MTDKALARTQTARSFKKSQKLRIGKEKKDLSSWRTENANVRDGKMRRKLIGGQTGKEKQTGESH